MTADSLDMGATSRGGPRVLLTVSGRVDPETAELVARGQRPSPDYIELARAMDADIMDTAKAKRAAGGAARVLGRLAPPLLLAWVCFRQRGRYDVILTDGEQVGFPLAALLKLSPRRRCAHMMIVHILSVRKKVWAYRALRLGSAIDVMLVYSSWQQQFIRDELHYPSDRIVLTSFMVDTRFFAPGQACPRRPVDVCAVGLEFRDYPTLVEAVSGLDISVVIAAASNWSKRGDTTRGVELPPNVEVCSLGFVDLRQLYADAELVVMPLYDVDFQAGVTTLLEAMAMEKPVICSRTRGQTDLIVDNVTGRYVAPRDSVQLGRVITTLLDDPRERQRLGSAARRHVTENCDVRTYARRLAKIAHWAASLGPRSPSWSGRPPS